MHPNICSRLMKCISKYMELIPALPDATTVCWTSMPLTSHSFLAASLLDDDVSLSVHNYHFPAISSVDTKEASISALCSVQRGAVNWYPYEWLLLLSRARIEMSKTDSTFGTTIMSPVAEGKSMQSRCKKMMTKSDILSRARKETSKADSKLFFGTTITRQTSSRW